MPIISLQFAVFVTVVVIAYFTLPARWRWAVLLAAGAGFYASYSLRAAIYLAAGISADYALAHLIGRTADPRRRKLYLGLSLALNLGGLALFKYLTPVVRGLAAGPGWLAVARTLHVLGTPLGLSFFTFARLGYVIDVYRRKTQPEPHLGYFASFVAFFPNLTSGPIERADHWLPQLKARLRFDPQGAEDGMRRILWGLFKKVVIADRLGLYIDAVYNQPRYVGGQALFAGTVFLAFQIYADFSAYTDIAVGIARLLGFELFENFRQPYFATSLLDFWRRWHMSLTDWIREYVLFPLSRGLLRAYRRRLSPQVIQALAYLVVMGLVGLWHGGQWTFVAWGLLHGVYLTIELLLPPRLRQAPQSRWEAVARAGVTFSLVSLAWILFRANSLHDAGYVVSHLLAWQGDFMTGLVAVVPVDPAITALFQLLRLSTANYQTLQLAQVGLSVGLIGVLLLADWGDARGGFLRAVAARQAGLRWGFYYATTAAVLFLGVWGRQEFIYFRF